MAGGSDASMRLTDAARAIADCAGIERVCGALESGLLDRASTAAVRGAVAGGNAALEGHLRTLQEAWGLLGADIPPRAVALALRTSAGCLAAERQLAPNAQVAWTGPRVEGSFLRSTKEVVREILRGARAEILVVGYWIVAQGDTEGVIEEVIASLAEAVARGVAVAVVVDERVRPDGSDNKSILAAAWPEGVPLPQILTWRLPPDDRHLKLHAKVLVADRRDALVTSANLTSYAMERNMEMGVRIVGLPASDIANHFDLLAANGVLERFGAAAEPQ